MYSHNKQSESTHRRRARRYSKVISKTRDLNLFFHLVTNSARPCLYYHQRWPINLSTAPPRCRQPRCRPGFSVDSPVMDRIKLSTRYPIQGQSTGEESWTVVAQHWASHSLFTKHRLLMHVDSFQEIFVCTLALTSRAHIFLIAKNGSITEGGGLKYGRISIISL